MIQAVFELEAQLRKCLFGYNEFELLFDPKAQGRSEIRIRFPDGMKEKWKPVDFLKLDSKQLTEYEGEYYCPDLESVYRLSVTDGKLFVQFNYGRKRRLLPTVSDTFKTHNERFPGMIFTFSRDAARVINGFGVDFDRVRDLRFQKRGL